jgi:RimJ/RimL family protein N-acetyltransferase
MMKGSGTDINLHVFSEYAAEIERMLAFRDWLRNHEDDRHKYEKVKRELARQIWQHIQHYADAKTGIIEDILGRALGTKMILETKRLYLREMTQADFPLLCKHLQDVDVMYAYEHAFSDAEVQEGIDKQFQRYEKDGFGVWAVIHKDNGELIGQCGLSMQPVEDKEVLEIGYIFQKEYWHKGYATEAAIACREYAFDKLDANEVFSLIRDTNLASQNVAKRNGMSVRGTFIKHYYGVDMLHYIYSVKRC